MNYIFAVAVGLTLITIISGGGNTFVDESLVTPITQQTTFTLADDQAFDAFKLKYKKTYATPELEKKAKTILLKRKAEVEAHNLLYEQGLIGYAIGIWEYSDHTMEDIAQIRRTNRSFKASELIRSFKETATEEQLKAIIDKHGKIPATLDTSDKLFLSYKSGVYKCKNTEVNLQLKVLIVGYGTENNNDYWVCKTSLGTSFGESGTFKIVKRNSPCLIKPIKFDLKTK